MLKELIARFRQGHRTIAFPAAEPQLPDRFRGRPSWERAKCVADCMECAKVCPTGAIQGAGPAGLDLGRCLFCEDCARACPSGALRFTRDFRLAARSRQDLITSDGTLKEMEGLSAQLRGLLGRSLKLRQVSAGGCGACEADVNVLSTVVFDLGRFGVQFVASPRHADGLLITGPVTKSMELALRKTYDAVPAPKIVIACGACAVSGGPYLGSPQVLDGAAGVVPVDLFIPGCPPHPLTILDAILRLLGPR